MSRFHNERLPVLVPKISSPIARDTARELLRLEEEEVWEGELMPSEHDWVTEDYTGEDDLTGRDRLDRAARYRKAQQAYSRDLAWTDERTQSLRR